MPDTKSDKLQLQKYSRTKSQLHNHRPWYIYTAAAELEQPFSLDQLQDAIYRKVKIRPQKKRLLAETREFYDKYDISIINRTEPEADSFAVNQEIDLENTHYLSIIRPPQEYPGRPRKNYIQNL